MVNNLNHKISINYKYLMRCSYIPSKYSWNNTGHLCYAFIDTGLSYWDSKYL